jgi:branched-chain amino acid transport system substrate-binding protein
MKLPVRLATSFAIGGLIAMLGACSPAAPDTVKIAVAATLTGPSGSRGVDLVRGAQLAADELNAEGFKIGGKLVKIEVVQKDDKADPETAKKVAQELLDEKVQAVIGHVNTPLNQAVIPVYATQKMPQLMASTTVSLMKLGQGNVFRLVANDDLQSRALAAYAAETLHAKSIAVIGENNEFGREMLAGIKKTLEPTKAKVILNQEIDFKAKVTKEMALQIKDAKADAIIVIGREIHSTSLVEQLAAVGATEIPVLAANPAKTSNVAKAARHPGGLYVSSTTIEPSELPGGPNFLKAFEAKYKSQPVWGAHYAYDTLISLANAMQDNGSIDREALINRLKTKELRSKVFQNFRFDANGEQMYPSIGIYMAVDGRWEVKTRSMDW